ncbi:MAG: hypothetical protein AAF483_20675 [Planctomycetota bacterium]
MNTDIGPDIWIDEHYLVAYHEGWIAWAQGDQSSLNKTAESIRNGTSIKKAVGMLGSKFEVANLRRITLIDDTATFVIKRKVEVSNLVLTNRSMAQEIFDKMRNGLGSNATMRHGKLRFSEAPPTKELAIAIPLGFFALLCLLGGAYEGISTAPRGRGSGILLVLSAIGDFLGPVVIMVIGVIFLAACAYSVFRYSKNMPSAQIIEVN